MNHSDMTSSSSSLAEFFGRILDKDTPALRPAVKITTTIEKFEALLPQEILECICPSPDGSTRSGGRPRKNAGSKAPLKSSVEDIWKKSSYVPFLYNAYRNAKARRQQMVQALYKSPASILLSAEKKAQDVLYKKGDPCFDSKLLTEALTADSCIPVKLQENRRQYKQQMLYYMRTSPERAFSRAILALILAEESDSCMDILFPALEYVDGDSSYLMSHADQLFQKGRYKESKDNYQAILSDRDNPDRAKAALKIGRMYRCGYGCEPSPSDAFAMFREAVKNGVRVCPDAAYELYICERDGAGTPGGKKDTKAAWNHLLEAADAGSIPALLELGGMYYAGNDLFHIEKNMAKAEEYYRTGAGKNDISCEKMYGKCLQNRGNVTKARYWYFRAARQGDMDASILLSELDLSSPCAPVTVRTSEKSAHAAAPGICFTGAQNEMTDTFIQSLPKGWITKPLSAFEEAITRGMQDLPLILFIADENVQKNMGDLYRVIRFLETMPAADDMKKRIAQKLHIYVRTQGNDDVEIKAVDSFNSVNELRAKIESSQNGSAESLPSSGYRDLYYHIRICNPVRDGSQYLLAHAPLFLPALQDRRQKPHILLIGSGPAAVQLICDMLSVFPLTGDGKPLHICVLSENAQEVQWAVEEQIPELTSKKSQIPCDLNYYAVTGHDLHNLVVTGRLSDSAQEKELQKVLFESNYYVVCGENSRENVKTATWLRGALLSSSSEFGGLPFIAAYVRDNLLAQQASHFSVINEGIGFSWYNNYNLFCFGSSRDLYTYQNLEEGYMEKRSLALHMSYYKDDVGSRAQAQRDYWCRYYNRDSSRMSALSIIYKAFLAGITQESIYDYGQENRESLLSDPFKTWISDPDHLESAARMEHERWKYFACSRGWRHATIEQMNNYIDMGNPRQQLYLAQLHPCIVSWQKLPEVQKAYNQIQRRKNPDWKDRDLIRSDYDIIRIIPELLMYR